MVIAIIEAFSDCSFAISFPDISAKEKVKVYMLDGLSAWFSATDPDEYKGSLFTKEEIENYYWKGYAEPTTDLLNKEDIEHCLVDIELNENDEVINADEVIYF